MKPSQFSSPPLTDNQIAKRLYELGITPADVSVHNSFHEHKATHDGLLCLWEKHLHSPELGVSEILSTRKADEPDLI